mmetsp:Transcript_17752/g.60310  ORF Transcript_17752/g.60310 Transcript_17752/m.60310 type:complete len:326 (-) Transcript_17752:343-1320(-)
MLRPRALLGPAAAVLRGRGGVEEGLSRGQQRLVGEGGEGHVSQPGQPQAREEHGAHRHRSRRGDDHGRSARHENAQRGQRAARGEEHGHPPRLVEELREEEHRERLGRHHHVQRCSSRGGLPWRRGLLGRRHHGHGALRTATAAPGRPRHRGLVLVQQRVLQRHERHAQEQREGHPAVPGRRGRRIPRHGGRHGGRRERPRHGPPGRAGVPLEALGAAAPPPARAAGRGPRELGHHAAVHHRRAGGRGEDVEARGELERRENEPRERKEPGGLDEVAGAQDHPEGHETPRAPAHARGRRADRGRRAFLRRGGGRGRALRERGLVK